MLGKQIKPKNPKRVIAGRKAQQTGIFFENTIRNYAQVQGWKVLRMPDACRQTKRGPVRIKSPFDFIACKNFGDRSAHIYFDAKFTGQGTFSPSDIPDHQLVALANFGGIHGVMTGYIIMFDKHDRVVFYPTSHLLQAVAMRRGLRHDEGLVLGSRQRIYFDGIYEGRDMLALAVK